MGDKIAVKVKITGRVQGVFFRATTRDAARSRHLAGHVKNLPDGSVEALFQGPDLAVEEMLAWCWKGSPGSKVDQVRKAPAPLDPDLEGFQVRY